jgi:hypothetical protein
MKKIQKISIILAIGVVLVLSYLSIIPEKPIKAINVSPQPDSTVISLLQPIIIEFENNLKPSQKQKLEITTQPFVHLRSNWNNDKIIALIPEPILNQKTSYQVSVLYQKKLIYQWSFTTPTFNQLGESEKIRVEGILDPAGQALKEAVEEKPWLLKLPIKQKNYTISYLESKQIFRVLMKFDITSPLSKEEQVSQVKLEAPLKLEEIGVDLTKESIYYTFAP